MTQNQQKMLDRFVDEALQGAERFSEPPEAHGLTLAHIWRAAAKRLKEQLEDLSVRAEERLKMIDEAEDRTERMRVKYADLEEQYETLRGAAEDLYLSVVGPARIIGPFEYVRPEKLIALRDALEGSYPASVPPDGGTPSHPGSEAVTTGVHHGRSSRRGASNQDTDPASSLVTNDPARDSS